MAHPHKADSEALRSAKLKAMTSHYGAANPSMNKLAPDDLLKDEGPEDVPSFGADSSAPKARGDRPGRRTAAANPVATYKKGGRVKHRDTGGDVSAIEAANRDQAMAKPTERARGGRTKGKHGTHVNVIVAPQGGAPGAGAMPPPVIPVGGPPGLPPGAGAAPPMPPPRPPMGAMPPPGMPMAPGAPGGLPPGIMPPRAKGGRVHADEAEDRALFKKMMKEEKHTKRARGGAIKSIHDMDAGAMSGPGRLEKIELQKHNKMKSQAV